MATIYLSPTGNDTTGNGSTSTPYKTLFKCIAVASNGDTIYHLNGTYTDLGTVATISKTLTITGSSPSNVILSVSTYNAWTYGTLFRCGANVTFSNLRIDSWQHGYDTATASDALFGRTANSVNMTLQNLIVSNAKHKARSSYDRGGLISTGNGGTPYYGGSYTIDRCLFYNIEQYGVSAPTVSGYMINSVGTAALTVTFTVTNCTFHFRSPSSGNSASNGIWHYQSYNTVVWKNNIIYNETGGTFNWTAWTNATTSTFQNNDSYLLTGAPSGTNNITSDPLFIDLTNRDFRLRPSSPCVKAGQLL